ncbi:chaplin [Streptomyces sp. NPDC048349]|uniref:chaplin n=1 Tax=Streptomyces sp. NPDC048349 TaxID=3155486 RepID=UPI0034421AED
MKHKKAAVLTAGVLMAAGAASPALASSDATGAAVESPGVASGNAIQVPIAIPINLCGNSINVIGLLNPTFGNVCINR